MGGKRDFGRLRKLPSGRWQARYDGPDGRTRAAPHTFLTKTDARRFLAGVETDLRRGVYRDTQAAQVTVGVWVRRFLDAHAVGLKPSTVASYDSLYTCCIAPHLAHHHLDRLRRTHVREWVATLVGQGLSASRTQQALVVLSKAIEAAVDDDLISANPCRGVRPPPLPATEPTILSAGQVHALREAIRPPYGLLVDLLAVGGLRIGEALALRRRSVDLLRGRLLVQESLSEVGGKHTFGSTKAHQEREVALPGFLVRRLSEHLDAVPADPRALLFTSSVGGPVRYRSLIRYAWAPAVAATGLSGVTPHDLRATCASWVAEEHGVMAAARHLGHSSASVTTRHYARARQGIDAAVVAFFEAAFDGVGGRAAESIGHVAGTPTISRTPQKPLSRQNALRKAR